MGPATTMTPARSDGRQHVALGWVRHDEALTKMAAACWARDRFTDVTIFCEDRVLHAHRLVLASMSPLLANLLAESEGSETALLLPEVKAEDMRLLLQFIYQGEVVLPPRRTAALLDLAAQLCVAGVLGGGQTTPPSPPRSDTPELDSNDRTNDESEDIHISEDEHPSEVTTTCDAASDNSTASSFNNKESATGTKVMDDKSIVVDEDETDANDSTSNVGDESNDGPMNLAAKPEIKVNGTTNCPRPKPCNSSPPDLNVSQTSATNTPSSGRSVYNSARNSTMSYYQHPALRGCHPFSLELAGDHHRHLRAPIESLRSKRPLSNSSSSKTPADAGDSDVEVTMNVTGGDMDHEREIDLSLSNKMSHCNRSTSEEKMTPSPDQDSSLGSNESMEQLKGRGLYIHPGGGSGGTLSSSLADKLFLMPSGGPGGAMDPRRTYLETVLQESLVQQSYTIVLPSHLSGNTMPVNPDHRHLTPTSLHGQALDSSKAWNLTGKNSAAAAVAELQCLQGLFASRESGYGRGALMSACDEDEDEDEDSEMPTNLSTAKNGNCGSNNSLNSKRNGKEGYSCQVCRKMFTSSSNLAVHSMIHSGTKPFKCDLCSWSFRQKAHLQKHMRHIHKIIVAK